MHLRLTNQLSLLLTLEELQKKVTKLKGEDLNTKQKLSRLKKIRQQFEVHLKLSQMHGTYSDKVSSNMLVSLHRPQLLLKGDKEYRFDNAFFSKCFPYLFKGRVNEIPVSSRKISR